jgi:hypothetical protein
MSKATPQWPQIRCSQAPAARLAAVRQAIEQYCLCWEGAQVKSTRQCAHVTAMGMLIL